MKDCEKMLKINLNVTKEKINVIIDEMQKSFFLFTFKYNILYDVMWIYDVNVNVNKTKNNKSKTLIHRNDVNDYDSKHQT